MSDREDILSRQVTAYAEEVAALRQELAETNQGVVALYAELDDNAAKLKEASELKSRFLSYMSHEFRTPLGAIRSIARILVDRLDGPLTDEQARQVRFIQDAGAELTNMVDDLLDLAKVEAGRVTISPAWFEMVDLFSALRGMFKPILSNDAVSLIFEAPHDVPPVFTDDKKLSQVLRNFISNALKFTSEGEVRVTATLSDSGLVTFAVSDTGIGIAAEDLGAIFQDFVQVDAPIQKKLRGTGLGLSLSKKLAGMLGGDVHVTSEVGKGSIFSVTIPLSLPGHVTAARPQGSEQPRHA
ncbi:MAG TPA: ATP-binding protein [Candidatus Limnocylindrales bacterium]|nr:ATP-binding protein [Candidatus Limnocylindrales bacterium]